MLLTGFTNRKIKLRLISVEIGNFENKNSFIKYIHIVSIKLTYSCRDIKNDSIVLSFINRVI